MKIGLVGLGKMGGGMARRLLRGGHEVVAFDRKTAARRAAQKHGAILSASLKELVKKLDPPRVVWLMLPAGEATQEAFTECSRLLKKGDILIDGGNSFYRDSIRRGALLQTRGIRFLDVGTSGGLAASSLGYCLMVGGEKQTYKKAEPLLRALAAKDGYAHVGPDGAGHFVKMVHNGIEYALLQSYAEGFEILNSSRGFKLDLRRIARLWNRGSVIRSWLLELLESIFRNDPELKSLCGYVEDSGEGRWTVAEAIDHSVPAPLITLSLLERFRSRREESFSAKVIAALRREFGGHAVKRRERGKRR